MQSERAEASRLTAGQHAPISQDLRSLSSFLVGWEARIDTLENEMSKKNGEIVLQTARVRDAEAQKLVLEKLRERQFTAWTREADRRVETASQELWLYSHTLKNRGDSQ
jgi:flagellar biosynthesis chaperone FliJ